MELVPYTLAFSPTKVRGGFRILTIALTNTATLDLSSAPQVWSYFAKLRKVALPQVATNSCWEAPVSGGPHPVVVFTHGYTGTFTDYTFLFEDLASRGYVVASVDHTYEATAVEFPDGRMIKSVMGSYLANTEKTDVQSVTFAVEVRLSDLKFVMNQLEGLNAGSNNPFAGKLDMSRVALAGHSLGGLTALLGVQEDPRFRAGVILEGALPDSVAIGTQTPMLVMTMGNDGWGADDCRLWDSLRGPRLAVNLKGAEHVTPSDAVWLARNAIKHRHHGRGEDHRDSAQLRGRISGREPERLAGGSAAEGSIARVPGCSGDQAGSVAVRAAMKRYGVMRWIGLAVVIVTVLIYGRRKPQRAYGMSQQTSMQAEEHTTRAVVERFNQAFNRHDADALGELLTDDTVFEDTSPAPDGRRVEGKAAVTEFWRTWFARNPDARFEAEEIITSGNRAVVRWVYRKMRNGQPWHLRGVDIFTVRGGKVAAKLAYVKG